MTSFEFFTVLLSFVVSLGVAGLLLAVVRLIQESNRVRFSLTWALWAVAIFIVQVVFWLKSWTYHEHYKLMTQTSIPPLILAIAAFVACGLATPHVLDAGDIDLVRFHRENARKYQIAYALFMFVATAQSALMRDVADSQTISNFIPDTAIQMGIGLLCALTALLQRQSWLQLATPVVLIVGNVFYYGRLMEL